MGELLYGRNATREALRAGRRTRQRLYLASGVQQNRRIDELAQLAQQAKVPIEQPNRQWLDQQTRGANHQGVALAVGSYPYVDLDELLAYVAEQPEEPFLLILDHLQDPQNVGTLLRTAEAVGVHGILLPSRRAVAITPAVVNASSGATEHLRITLVTNLAQTIATLQQANIWIAGLQSDPAATDLDQTDLNRSLALVVGAEGPGLARLTRERCDFLVNLPMRGQLDSLNAAVAGSITLYAAWQQRRTLSAS